MSTSVSNAPGRKAFSYTDDFSIPRAVKIWLWVGVVMVFLQIFIGGVTRLTGSGLSITKWEVVRGSIPPLSAQAWEDEFVLYQQTPQYQKINQGMSLAEFKFIYFWEYFHRLWARMMFFVFIIPFFIFWWRGMFSRRLMPRLGTVMLLAGLEGFFGWIMVASGLIHRPWVNAYNLTLHLTMGIVIYSYLLWTVFRVQSPQVEAGVERRSGWLLVGIAFLQIALGAMVSGTKAALAYPTWPDMHGVYVPSILFDGAYWNADSFTHYDINSFVPALVQFLHRNIAYILTFLIIYTLWRNRPTNPAQRTAAILTGLLISVQVLLGILTLLKSVGGIPVTLGVLHQAGAVFLLSALLYFTYHRGTQFR